MSFVPMSIGGGAQIVETVLWTNESPTSSFASQILQFDTISNYDYLVIEVRVSSAVADTYKFYYDTTDLASYISGQKHLPLIGVLNTNNYYYYRPVAYVGTQMIQIGTCYRNTASSAASSNNAAIIPTQVIGVTIT